MSLITEYGGADLPHVKFRPNAHITTRWGHDIDPVEDKYRFHRAVDRAGGDGKVYVPFTSLGYILETDSPSYGTLLRLQYQWGEVRIAHMQEFNKLFLDKKNTLIGAGTLIGKEGSIGKSTGKHTHTEIVIPTITDEIKELALARGMVLGMFWSETDIKERLGNVYKDWQAWKKQYAVYAVGPYEMVAYDRRTDRMAHWFDSLVLFDF